MRVSLHAFSEYSFLFFVFIAIVLPSGHVGPVNVKLAALLVAALLLFIVCKRYSSASLLLLLSFISWLVIWFVIGSVNLGSIYMPLLQAKASAVTFFIPFMAYTLLVNRIISSQQIFMTIVYSSIGLAITKISLLIISVGFNIPFYLLVKYLSIYFNAQIMTMHIVGPLYRYEVVSDLLTPVALFILLHNNKFGRVKLNIKVKIFMVAILLFSVFLAYSRYIYFMAFIAIILASISNRVLLKYIIFSLVFGALIFVFSVGNLHFITQRFASGAVTVSDNIRLRELSALINYYLRSPIFGHGLGSYVPTLIRDAKDKFSYELQWLALLMQTGILGFLFIAILMAIVSRKYISNKFSRSRMDLFFMFLLWLSASVFNAYLISSASGVIFTFFVAESYAISHKSD